MKDTTETIEGANFFIRFLIRSSLDKKSKNRMINRMDPKTTAGFIWLKRGRTRSIILYSTKFTSRLIFNL